MYSPSVNLKSSSGKRFMMIESILRVSWPRVLARWLWSRSFFGAFRKDLTTCWTIVSIKGPSRVFPLSTRF